VLGPGLATLLGISMTNLEARLCGSDVRSSDERSNVWATVLAIKLFETELVGERSVWQLVVDKARAWLVQVLVVGEDDIKELEKLAAEVLSV